MTASCVPRTAHLLTVRNATPGVTELIAEVNGRRLPPVHLADGETTTIDIGSELRPGTENTVRLTATGQPGGSAVVLIHN